MALNTNEINAVASDYIVGKTTDNYFTGNALFHKLLPKAKKFDGGNNIKEPLVYNKQNGGAYRGVGKFNLDLVEIITAAKFAPSRYYVTCVISTDEEDTCNGSAEEVDLIQSKIDNAIMTMEDTLGTDLYASTVAATGTLIGLPNLFLSTSSTAYGDIAEDDMSTWAPNNVDASSSTFDLSLIQSGVRGARVGNAVPDLHITDPTVYDAYENLLIPSKRYTDTKMAAAGFANLMYKSDGPVIADQKLTYSAGSAVWYGLNTKYLFLRVHTNRFMRWSKFQDIQDGAGRSAKLLSRLQLTCNQRRAHFRIQSITV